MSMSESSPIPAPVASSEQVLRSVDLNLLTVFDAVMQEQNITREIGRAHV